LNKKTFYLFRTNLRNLEYYHEYNNLQAFKNKCHDFYLLQLIWFLENNYIDKAVVWRLQPNNKKMVDIIFDINGKQFIQKFVDNFSECFKYEKPYITFWRGGFKEYDYLTKSNPKFFGSRSLYLGASKRITPQFGGIYSKILVESNDLIRNNTFPFFKTANENIFFPMNIEKEYDICWPNNFTQLRYKGQEFFIKEISNSKYLKSLSIIHTGNKPEIGKSLCKKYNVNNIQFVGWLDRNDLNTVLNQSKIGLVTSNLNDGCPRISTEIMMSGTLLLLREKTRLLNYYKKYGVVIFKDNNVESKIRNSLKNYSLFHKDIIEKNVNLNLTMENVCKKNFRIWLRNKHNP